MSEPSGRAWCSRFPTSHSISGLATPFRDHAAAFVAAIIAGGGRVQVNATRRPAERAYLMHYAWAIAREGVDPATVPAHAGVDIEWDHDDAKAAAEAMVEGYGMAHQAALDSLHIQGQAIDMDIEVPNGAVITDAEGTRFTFHGAATGQDPRLHAIGATYGVLKLLTDRPHWSSTGH